MPTPVEFMNLYRNISIKAEFDDPKARACRIITASVKLNKYFMMDWTEGTSAKRHYQAVSASSSKTAWFHQNKESIETAAMGKGSPEDYALALEWAVYAKHIRHPSQITIQAYFDQNMGIDCSGFVTNYLIANGKKSDSTSTRRGTSAASYFNPAKAVNDPSDVRQGDLLVIMNHNAVKTDPGHVTVVESYVPQSSPTGNMRVVESTGAAGAHPKLLDSMYIVEKIIDKGGHVPCMMFVVKRHGESGSRFSVMRV
jgi:hypothetical protein